MNVISAKFGTKLNSLESGVLIETDESGWVATCKIDAPHSGGAWEALQTWLAEGNTIAAYAQPL